MPITREFVFADGGLMPVDMLNADPGTGRLVAHDILEHFSHKGDPVENELMAIGALYLLRLESGAQRADYSIPLQTLLARNIIDVLQDLMEDEALAAPRRRRVHDRDELPLAVVQAAVEEAFVMLDSESRRSPDWSQERKAELLAHKKSFSDWVLAGYQKATARYANSDAYTVASTLFDDIARTADAVIDSSALSEGDRVRISVDFHHFSVNCRLRHQGYNRWYEPKALM